MNYSENIFDNKPPYEHICGCFKIQNLQQTCLNVEFC